MASKKSNNGAVILTTAGRKSDTVKVETGEVLDSNGKMHQTLVVTLLTDMVLESNEYGKRLAFIGGPSISRKSGKGYWAGSVYEINGKSYKLSVQLDEIEPRQITNAPRLNAVVSF